MEKGLTLVLATYNAKKAVELQEILQPLEVRVMTLSDAGVTVMPEETGVTFAENAYIKAKAALEATGLTCLADDSGLCVDALDGRPGVYSARWGGLGSDAERNEHLLRQMEGITQRTARFVCAIVCLLPGPNGTETRIDASGECVGELLTEPCGESGFGYDPLFFLPEYGKSMAELTPEEKNKISHRGQALRSLLEKWPL